MVGLGCEVFQISMFKETFGLEEGKNFVTLVMQEMGGSRKTIEKVYGGSRKFCRPQTRPPAKQCPRAN